MKTLNCNCKRKKDLENNSGKCKLSMKQKEAKARRQIAETWSIVSHKMHYQKAAVKEFCNRTTLQMEEELFDGIVLNLRNKNRMRPYSAQKRILRRVIEKRQAQQIYRNVGRTPDRFASHVLLHCASKSMNDLRNYQLCI